MGEKKVTWNDVYKDFRKRHPKMRKHTVGFQPYDFAEVVVYIDDGRKLIYNYDTKRSRLKKN